MKTKNRRAPIKRNKTKKSTRKGIYWYNVHTLTSKMQGKEAEPLLALHLQGKSTKSMLISLEDLQDIASGVNGLANYFIRKKLGLASRGRFDKTTKAAFSLGISSLKPTGSVTLEVMAYGKQDQLESESKIRPLELFTDLVDSIESLKNEKISAIPLDIVPYLDSITKPLDDGATLDGGIYVSGKRIKEIQIMTSVIRVRVQELLEKRRITSEKLYGTLKILNLRDYSAKIQTFSKLEIFHFDSSEWQTIRDLLQSRVEVTVETEDKGRNLISIKPIESFQEKREMTPADLLNSGIIGLLEHRQDINAIEYSEKLANEVFG